MNGYVLHTDPAWLALHRSDHDGQEVLFTRGPRGGLVNLPAGGLLVFIERGVRPHVIGGIGVFLRNELTTLENAWRDYGQLVGVATRPAYLNANAEWLDDGGAVTVLHVGNFRGVAPNRPLANAGVISRPYAARGWHLPDDQWQAVRLALDASDIASTPPISELERDFGPTGEEGRRRQRTHLRLERDWRIVMAAKREWVETDPNLPCEVCAFSFVARYGEHGRDFIEAHHRKPLAQLSENEIARTRIEDLAPVCASCHRMLHANGGIAIVELAAMLQQNAV